jgi:hypothetical protein
LKGGKVKKNLLLTKEGVWLDLFYFILLLRGQGGGFFKKSLWGVGGGGWFN